MRQKEYYDMTLHQFIFYFGGCCFSHSSFSNLIFKCWPHWFLGKLTSLLYTLSRQSLIHSCGFDYHSYTDESQMHTSIADLSYKH